MTKYEIAGIVLLIVILLGIIFYGGKEIREDIESVSFSTNFEYCQNLYWNPDAERKMREYGCDITSVTREIQRVKQGY